jgi:hypothetical protein
MPGSSCWLYGTLDKSRPRNGRINTFGAVGVIQSHEAARYRRTILIGSWTLGVILSALTPMLAAHGRDRRLVGTPLLMAVTLIIPTALRIRKGHEPFGLALLTNVSSLVTGAGLGFTLAAATAARPELYMTGGELLVFASMVTPLAIAFYRRIVRYEEDERREDEAFKERQVRLEAMTDEEKVEEVNRVSEENEAWFADFNIRMRRRLLLLGAIFLLGTGLVILTYAFRDALP